MMSERRVGREVVEMGVCGVVWDDFMICMRVGVGGGGVANEHCRGRRVRVRKGWEGVGKVK